MNAQHRTREKRLAVWVIALSIACGLTLVPPAIKSVSAQASAPTETQNAKKTTEDPADRDSNQMQSKPELPKSKSRLSPETFRMIEQLEKKNRELKKREEELKQKELTLKTLEAKILADLDRVDQALAKSKAEFGMRQEFIDKNIDSLVKVYSAMKPADAANLLGALDEDIAVQIISRMKHKTAGPIMAKMDRKVAKAISEKIAGVRASRKAKKNPSGK